MPLLAPGEVSWGNRPVPVTVTLVQVQVRQHGFEPSLQPTRSCLSCTHCSPTHIETGVSSDGDTLGSYYVRHGERDYCDGKRVLYAATMLL